MNNRELVIDLVTLLPKDTSLKKIVRKSELVAGLLEARRVAAREQGISPEEAKRMVDGWSVLQSSRLRRWPPQPLQKCASKVERLVCQKSSAVLTTMRINTRQRQGAPRVGHLTGLAITSAP